MDFLFATANMPFTVALALLVLLVLVEMGMGGGLTELMDAFAPDLDLDDVPGTSHSLPSQLLNWLRAGRVPLLMLLAIFLGIFGVGGLLIQGLSIHLTESLMPMSLAALMMFVLALPMLRFAAAVLSNLLPRDDSQVVSRDELIGQAALIILGTARQGEPAQAKLTDTFRTTHYLMVEPCDADGVLEQGARIRIRERHGAIYRAERIESAALTRQSL